jgi:hypothetical protein
MLSKSFSIPRPITPALVPLLPDHSEVNLEGGLQLVEHALQGFHRV